MRRVVAGVVVLCCAWAVYIRYVSPTRVALVNFPAYQASSIALANESRWVRVDVLTVEEAAKIGRYDVALFFGPGLRLNGDQAAKHSGYKPPTNNTIRQPRQPPAAPFYDAYISLTLNS